jgi:hypothetical protein
MSSHGGGLCSPVLLLFVFFTTAFEVSPVNFKRLCGPLLGRTLLLLFFGIMIAAPQASRTLAA